MDISYNQETRDFFLKEIDEKFNKMLLGIHHINRKDYLTTPFLKQSYDYGKNLGLDEVYRLKLCCVQLQEILDEDLNNKILTKKNI